jgi:dolichol kinase
LLHFSSGAILLLVPLTSWLVLRVVLACGALLAALVEVTRLRVPGVARLLRSTVPVYRARERTQASGAMWLAIGYALAAFADPPGPAAGILVAACADPAAALMGSRGARGSVTGKTIRGTAVHWLVAAVVLGILGWSWSVIVIGASVASAVERWPLGLDDNLLVPPATAFAVMLAA